MKEAQWDEFQVEPWIHWVGSFTERFPSLALGLGNAETEYLRDQLPPIKKPIYITGLARAGTTILLEIIADHPDVYLITGHVSSDEALRLTKLGKEYGIKKMLVSSTIFKIATIDQLSEMIENGAFIEYTLAAYGHSGGTRKTDYYVEIEYASDPIPSNFPKTSIKTVAEHTQELGADNCILATDFGVYTLPPPVEGFREFIALMLDLGVPESDIITMTRDNPEKLLGLS
jgi:predicted TIM-barrel fold metal-dependent hydrolase